MAGSVKRSSDDTRTMSVRQFLRGGYKEPGAPIIVLNGDSVAGVWSPGTVSVSVNMLAVSGDAVTPTNGVPHFTTVPPPTPIKAPSRRPKLPDLTKRA